jgi:hypothetical protein
MSNALLQKYLRHRFAWLFFSLLLTIAAQPVAQVIAPRLYLLEMLLATNLLAAIASAGGARGRRLLVALCVTFAATRSVAAVLGHDGLRSASQALWLSAGLFATAAAVRHALQATRVDGEHIFAALDAYLLAGLMFGVVCWVLDHLWPGSFGGAVEGSIALADAIYFGFVTIATLGYGDIVPLSDAARSLAILAALGGQMYLTVLVAWLVSLYAKSRNE